MDLDWEDIAIATGCVAFAGAVGYCAYRSKQEWEKHAEEKELKKELKALMATRVTMPKAAPANIQRQIDAAVTARFNALQASFDQQIKANTTIQQPQPQPVAPQPQTPTIVPQLTEDEWEHMGTLSNERLRGLLRNITPHQPLPQQESKKELIARMRAIEPFVLGASQLLRQALTFQPAQPQPQPVAPQQQPVVQPQQQEMIVNAGNESIQIPMVDVPAF